jgi:hypothetical protein
MIKNDFQQQAEDSNTRRRRSRGVGTGILSSSLCPLADQELENEFSVIERGNKGGKVSNMPVESYPGLRYATCTGVANSAINIRKCQGNIVHNW